MKLLALVVLGILFAVTLSQANNNTVSRNAIISELHKKLNACDADAKAIGVADYGICSDAQSNLIERYGSYEEYKVARKANQ